MSGVIQKFWHETLPVTVLDKLRNTLTLPAFCVRSGIDNGSVFFGPQQTTQMQFIIYAGADQYMDTAFTMECWFKTSSYFTDVEGILFVNSDGTNQITKLMLFQNKYVISVLDGFAIEKQITSQSTYPLNEWTHVAIVYNGQDISLYQNGILDQNGVAVGGPLLPGGIGTVLGAYAQQQKFVGHLAEVRMWNRVMSQSEIQWNYNKRKGKNDGLKRYYRLNEHDSPMHDFVNNTIQSTVPFDANTGIIQQSDTFPPLILGGSFVAARFPVNNLGLNLSLKYPVKKPRGANFMLCVAWLENEDDEFLSRRRLWDIDGVSIYPVMPDRYRGEVLPENFRFEVWNVDGAENCELASDLVIKVSHVTLPQHQRDINEPSLGTQIIDHSIFEPFVPPVSAVNVFPLQFLNDAWGTCDNPRQPDITLMSDGLTLWGGTGGFSGDEGPGHLILEGGEGDILSEGGEHLTPEG